MKVNYQEMEDRIHWAQAYEHGSSHATSGYDERGVLVYKVWSYNTLMLVVEGGIVTYFNNDYYSMTTSRLQNIIRRHWDVATVA